MGNEISSDNQIVGKWVNVRTNESVFARDIINDGDKALVVTDVGVIPMEQFMDFIKMDEDVQDSSIQPNTSMDMSGISTEDEDILKMAQTPKMPSLTEPFNGGSSSSKIEIETVSNNFKIIDKLFSKFPDNMPKLKVEIDWNGFPREQINNLVDIFDVPKEEICDYLAKKLLSPENIQETIKKEL